MTPQAAAHYLSALSERWNADGPDAVHRVLEQWTEDELRYFAMMNIGARAQLHTIASKQS